MNTKARLPSAQLFSKGRLKAVLIGQPDDLHGVCDLLNSEKTPPELSAEFRRLVMLWMESGPNLAKMLKADEALAARTKHGRTLLVPTQSGKGHLMWFPNPVGYNASSWKDQALCHFMDLIVNPHCHRLGGPCARCNKYYVKNTARQKKYCSRRCGSMLTAKIHTREKRDSEHSEKLHNAQSAANKWTTMKTAMTWKKWVSMRTNISVRWLSRAVNRGELREPK